MERSVSVIAISSVCLLLLVCACSNEAAQSARTDDPDVSEEVKTTKEADAAAEFIKADITIRFATGAKLKLGTTTITDPEDVKRLAAFFPDMGEGKTGPIFGGWEPTGTIEFFRSDDESVAVAFGADFEYWSEYSKGRGDWPLSAKFRPYLVNLVNGEDGTDGPS